MTDLEKREKQEVTTSTVEKMQNAGPSFSPDVDIYASDSAVYLVIDVPGVGKGDVSIQVDESNSLTINAKSKYKEPQNCVVRQYNAGNYYRSFQLSDDYDKDKVAAKLENGLLEITIPKKESAKPRKIEINV